MHERPRNGFACATLVAILLVGCSGRETGESGDSSPGAGDPTNGELPADHPPLAGGTPETVIVEPPPGSGIGEAGLAWTAPADWIAETPTSAMRRAQYKVPGPGGDGECVVFYFGPGQGGGAEANAARWANQFSQTDGRSPQEAMKTERIEVGEVSVLLTEVTGTYSGGMTMVTGASQDLADHMLLGAIAEASDANWFFKLTGPASTLEAQRGAFRSMIDSLSRGG